MRPFTTFEFWKTLFRGVDYRDHVAFQKGVKTADEFVASNAKDPQAWELLLEFANRKYEQALADYRRLDDKRDGFIKFAATLAGVLAVGSKGAGITFTIWFQLAVASFFMAMLVLLISRRSISIAGLPSIQDLREGIGAVANTRDWLAGALHKGTEGLKVTMDAVASHTDAGLFLMLLGILFTCVGIVLGRPVPITGP